MADVKKNPKQLEILEKVDARTETRGTVRCRRQADVQELKELAPAGTGAG